MKKTLTIIVLSLGLSQTTTSYADTSNLNEETNKNIYLKLVLNNNFVNPLLTESGKKSCNVDFDNRKGFAIAGSIGMGLKFDKVRFEMSGSYTGKQKWKYTDQLSKKDDLLTIDGFFWSMNLYYDLVNIGQATIYGGAGIGTHKLNYSYLKPSDKPIIIPAHYKGNVRIDDGFGGVLYSFSGGLSYPINESNEIELAYSFTHFCNPTGLKSEERDDYKFTNHTISVGYRFLF